MTSHRSARKKTTLIYVILSALVLVIGIALALWGNQESSTQRQDAQFLQKSALAFSVGTSLLAAGLASLGFAIIRSYDDADHNDLNQSLIDIKAEVISTRQSLIEEVISTRQSLRSARKIIPNATERCLFESDISLRFKSAIKDTPQDGNLEIYVVGLKLNRFLNDQLDDLKREAINREVNVKMLLQYPEGKIFSATCRLEGRDEKSTKDDILTTLKKLQGAKNEENELIYSSGKLTLTVRFYNNYQPIAFFRINDTLLIRPRIRTTGAGARFYETYLRSEGNEYFGLFLSHFTECWSKAHFRLPQDFGAKIKNLFL